MLWLALAVVFTPGAAEERTAEVHDTALTPIETFTFRVGSFAHTGGALEQWGDDLVVATPSGHILFARGAASRETEDIRVELLPERVPMALSRLWQTPFAEHASFNSRWFRLADILLADTGNDQAVLYASHHVVEAGCIAVVVSRIALGRSGDGPVHANGAWERVFRARPCIPPKDRGHVFSGHQVGGKMLWHPSGELWLALGDHGFDGVATDLRAPDNPDVDLGKVVAIDTNTGNSRIVAQGLRNPQGLLRSADGRIWETEHGPRGGDELNLIVEGRNYGWPFVTLGLGYGGPWPLSAAQGRHGGFEKPRFAFVPSVAVSALAEIRGPVFPIWEGDLALATLKDKALYRLRRDGDRIIYAERVLEVGARVRDIIGLQDGRLALLTERADIVLIAGAGEEPSRVRVTGRREIADRLEHERAAFGIPNKWTGEALFSRHCATCHRLDGVSDVGPHLTGLLTRAVGAADFDYSPSLSAADLMWEPELLFAYLRAPENVFPGTTMPRADLSPAEIREILDWLEKQAAK